MGGLEGFDPISWARFQLSLGAAAVSFASEIGLSPDSERELVLRINALGPTRQVELKAFLDRAVRAFSKEEVKEREPGGASAFTDNVIYLQDYARPPKSEAKTRIVQPKEVREYAPRIYIPLDTNLEVRTARRRMQDISKLADSDPGERDKAAREVISVLQQIEELPEESRASYRIATLHTACAEALESLMWPFIVKMSGIYNSISESVRPELRAVIITEVYRSARRFNHSYENTFLTFANISVRGAMKRYFRDEFTRGSGLPRTHYEKLTMIENQLAGGFSLDEALEHAGISSSEYTAIKADVDNYRTTTSIDIPDVGRLAKDQNTEDRNPEYMLTEIILDEDLQEALNRANLTQRELMIMKHRFGIVRTTDGSFVNSKNIERKSQAEIGSIIGVSQVHVGRIIVAIVQRCRDFLGIEGETLEESFFDEDEDTPQEYFD